MLCCKWRFSTLHCACTKTYTYAAVLKNRHFRYSLATFWTNSVAHIAAFTLIELSIVIVILSLLMAAGLSYRTANLSSANLSALNTTLDVVESALLNYGQTAQRLPYPADLTCAENVAAFGTEVSTIAAGNCTGYNFINSGTDPDNADGNYDSTTVSQVVAGAIPTKTLRIADQYAYDPWGRKILYAVDKRMTATRAYTTYPVYTANSAVWTANCAATGVSCAGAIAVKKATADTLANALTYKAVYALVSFGVNGHGGYVRNPASAAVVFNGGSTNTDEQKNCHCDSSAVATTFDRIFVQKNKTTDSTSFANTFDDIVRFKTRADLAVAISQLQ